MCYITSVTGSPVSATERMRVRVKESYDNISFSSIGDCSTPIAHTAHKGGLD